MTMTCSGAVQQLGAYKSHRRAGWFAIVLDTRLSPGSQPHARICGDTRGGDGGIRKKLATGNPPINGNAP
jgi:hypothetical protein